MTAEEIRIRISALKLAIELVAKAETRKGNWQWFNPFKAVAEEIEDEIRSLRAREKVAQ